MSHAQELMPDVGQASTAYEEALLCPVPKSLSKRRQRSGARAKWRGRAAWAGIAVGMVLLAVSFQQSLSRNFTWFVPLGYDQTVYLWTSYQTHDFMQTHSPGESLVAAMKQKQAQGSVLPWMTGLLFQVTGPTRTAALALNFLFFVVLQLTLAATLRWATGRWSASLFGLGLLLTAATPYTPCGMSDFRLDFITFCLYGIFLCAVMRSRFFESGRWAVAAGAVAGFMAIFRYITGVYLAGFFLLCFAFAITRWLAGLRVPDRRRAAGRQLTGVLLAGSVVAGVALPFFVRDFELLWDYYVVHHVIGPEKDTFAAIFGVHTPLDCVTFYGRSLLEDHTGRTFLGLAALSAVVCLVARFIATRRGASERPLPYHNASAYFMLLAALAVPYVVLTADVAKSPVVGNIMVMPLLLLVMLPVVRLARLRPRSGGRYRVVNLRLTDGGIVDLGDQQNSSGNGLQSIVQRLGGRRSATRFAVRALSALAVAAVVLGAHCQKKANAKTVWWARSRDAGDRVLALHDEVIRRTAARPDRTVHVSFNALLDYAFSATIMIRAYEVHHLQLHLVQELPTGCMLMEVDEATAMQALERSDLVVLTDNLRGLEIAPFHGSMEKFRPVMRAYCERTLVKVASYDINGMRFDLYERPAPQAKAQGS